MSYLPNDKGRKSSPWAPLVGFFVLVILGSASYFMAPSVVRWLTTTTFEMGAYGAILPITFPSNWTPQIRNISIALFMFLVQFIIFMIIVFAIQPTSRGEQDVDIHTMRKEFEARKKKKRTGR